MNSIEHQSFYLLLKRKPKPTLHCVESKHGRGVVSFGSLEELKAYRERDRELAEFNDHHEVDWREMARIVEGSGDGISLHHQDGGLAAMHWSKRGGW